MLFLKETKKSEKDRGVQVFVRCRLRGAFINTFTHTHEGACIPGTGEMGEGGEIDILAVCTRVRCARHGAVLFRSYCTMMWGAEKRTATVATIVKSVKTKRQMRSTTMAANFQSAMSSFSSSRFFSFDVMKRSSRMMACRSL